VWQLIKLLNSLAVSFPALATFLKGIAAGLQRMQAQARREKKDEAVDVAIADVERRMRNEVQRKREADGKE
jgi:hypothetical protein